MLGIEAKQLNLGFIRQFLTVWKFFRCFFCKLQMGLIGHSAIKPRLMKWCGDGCPSGSFYPSPHGISGAQPEWPLGSRSPLIPRPFSPECKWEALELKFKCHRKRPEYVCQCDSVFFLFFPLINLQKCLKIQNCEKSEGVWKLSECTVCHALQ